MLEPLEVEIRTLHAILGSEQDPEGRAFAPLADAYRRAKQPRKAFGLLTDGLARLPDFASGHVVAARLYAEQGLIEEGELAARRALELDPENVSALASLVTLLDAAGRTEEAVGVFATLEALEPEVLTEEGVPRPESTMDVGALAPEAADEPEAEVPLDVASLAPDEEVVLDVGALAPQSEGDEVLDVATLAPEPVGEEQVLDVASLAPADPAEAPVPDVESLAPEEEEPVLDVGSLAPEPVEEDPVLDIGFLAPDDRPTADAGSPSASTEPVRPADPDPRPDAGAAVRREGSEDGAPRIYTRTLGELYAKQGFVERAVEVFRQLHAERPEDPTLAERLEELEARLDGGDTPRAGARGLAAEGLPTGPAGGPEDRARERDEELEALARDLAEHRERQPEIDTPFAWAASEDAPDASEGEARGPTIGDYFDELLAYRSRGDHT